MQRRLLAPQHASTACQAMPAARMLALLHLLRTCSLMHGWHVRAVENPGSHATPAAWVGARCRGGQQQQVSSRTTVSAVDRRLLHRHRLPCVCRLAYRLPCVVQAAMRVQAAAVQAAVVQAAVRMQAAVVQAAVRVQAAPSSRLIFAGVSYALNSMPQHSGACTELAEGNTLQRLAEVQQKWGRRAARLLVQGCQHADIKLLPKKPWPAEVHGTEQYKEGCTLQA